MEKANPTSKQSKKNTLIGFVVLIVISLLISRAIGTKPTDNPTLSPTPSPMAVQEIKGKFEGYEYSILFEGGKNQYAASYKPFLPSNDDTILVQAMTEAVKASYKVDVGNPKPTIVNKNGTNVIMVGKDGKSYFFLPIKEDTGEIHSLVFWSE